MTTSLVLLVASVAFLVLGAVIGVKILVADDRAMTPRECGVVFGMLAASYIVAKIARYV